MTDDPLRWSKADIKLDKELELDLAQKKDLKRAFDYFDKTGAGLITENYLKIAFRALGFEPTPKELKKIVSEVVPDKKGLLSFHDFLDIMTKKMTEQDEECRVIQAYRLLNYDKTEGISFDNLKAVSEELGADLNDEEIQEMVEEGDIRMKGYVTLPDFKYIMDRFYRMQSKDAEWCFKYPKNFNYYATCSRKVRQNSDSSGEVGETDESSRPAGKEFVVSPTATKENLDHRLAREPDPPPKIPGMETGEDVNI